MQQHHTADEVQAQEHGDGQKDVHGHHTRDGRLVLRFDHRPLEGEVARDRVDGADENLHEQLDHAPPGDGDAPVLHAVVHREQLQRDATGC